MLPYLNAGFGRPLGPDDLSLIRQLGFAGIRTDVFPGEELPVIQSFKGTGLRPLLLVNGGKMHEYPEPAGGRASQVALMMHLEGVAGEIEIGNEPNIAEGMYKFHPENLTLSILTAYEIMQKDPRIRDTKLVVGGIMNTDRDGQAYLDAVVRSGLPADVIVGYHTYRQWDPPSKPSQGFGTRGAEFRALHDIVGGREMWNTEIGWHTAKEKKHFWSKPKGLNDEQVFARLGEEAGYNQRAGARVMVTFQLNDGYGDGYEDKFGIRTVDGSLKPSSRIAQVINA